MLLVFVSLVFCFSAFAQIGNAQNIVRWQSGSSHSDSIMSDGQELKIIYTNNISITATLIERKGWLPHAFVQIENKTPGRMLVDPSNWLLTIVTPKPMTLIAKVPEELVRSLEKRGAWAAAFGNVDAAFGTTQQAATLTDSTGKTSDGNSHRARQSGTGSCCGKWSGATGGNGFGRRLRPLVES